MDNCGVIKIDHNLWRQLDIPTSPNTVYQQGGDVCARIQKLLLLPDDYLVVEVTPRDTLVEVVVFSKHIPERRLGSMPVVTPYCTINTETNKPKLEHIEFSGDE